MLDDIWMLYKCICEYIYELYTFVSCVHACLFLCVWELWKYKNDVERGESDLKRSGNWVMEYMWHDTDEGKAGQGWVEWKWMTTLCEDTCINFSWLNPLLT